MVTPTHLMHIPQVDCRKKRGERAVPFLAELFLVKDQSGKVTGLGFQIEAPQSPRGRNAKKTLLYWLRETGISLRRCCRDQLWADIAAVLSFQDAVNAA